jgi:hypothetical protein
MAASPLGVHRARLPSLKKPHGVATECNRHGFVEDTVRDGRGQLLSDNRLDRILMGDHGCSIILEHLRASDMVKVRMSVDDVAHGHVKS